MKLFLRFNLIITSILLIQSCRDDYDLCNQPRDVKFVGGFFKKIGSTEISNPAPSLNIIQINTSANIYSNQPNVNLFSVPLSPVKDTSTFSIKVENYLQADTISIIYTSKEILLSDECGKVTYYTVSKILTTLHTIDSIKLTNPEVVTGLGQNAKFYF
jgi:hypothetical protein